MSAQALMIKLFRAGVSTILGSRLGAAAASEQPVEALLRFHLPEGLDGPVGEAVKLARKTEATVFLDRHARAWVLRHGPAEGEPLRLASELALDHPMVERVAVALAPHLVIPDDDPILASPPLEAIPDDGPPLHPDPYGMTIEQVMAWASAHPEYARDLHAAEQTGKSRKGLLHQLEELFEPTPEGALQEEDTDAELDTATDE